MIKKAIGVTGIVVSIPLVVTGCIILIPVASAIFGSKSTDKEKDEAYQQLAFFTIVPTVLISGSRYLLNSQYKI